MEIVSSNFRPVWKVHCNFFLCRFLRPCRNPNFTSWSINFWRIVQFWIFHELNIFCARPILLTLRRSIRALFWGEKHCEKMSSEANEIFCSLKSLWSFLLIIIPKWYFTAWSGLKYFFFICMKDKLHGSFIKSFQTKKDIWPEH